MALFLELQERGTVADGQMMLSGRGYLGDIAHWGPLSPPLLHGLAHREGEQAAAVPQDVEAAF